MISNTRQRLLSLALLTCAGLFQIPGEAHAVNDLALVDASFASQVVNRDPVRVSQSYRLSSLTDSRLWFWVHVNCTGVCEQKLAALTTVALLKPRQLQSLLRSLPVSAFR